MKVALDTDVIIRLLTGDDAEKQARARALFEAAGRGELELAIPATTIADTVFVLASQRLYAVGREDVAEMLTSLITLDGVEAEHRDRTLLALEHFATRNIDYGDAYVAAFAIELDRPVVCSFDHDFDGIVGIEPVEP